MKVMYSNDGINWAGNEMITLPDAATYVHTITSPTEARHVRILVSTTYTCFPLFRTGKILQLFQYFSHFPVFFKFFVFLTENVIHFSK